MTLPEEKTYLLQIGRHFPWPRRDWHTFLPLDRAELYVLNNELIEPVTPLQIADFKDQLVQIDEGELACMGLCLDPTEWDFSDRRFIRLICAALSDNRLFDITTIKARLALPADHGTWDDAHWGTLFEFIYR